MPELTQEYIALRDQYIESKFTRLNPVQRQAVFTTEGPLLILAGAGSGKTTVLVNRIANIIRFGCAHGSKELARTVTEQDLEELRKAVQSGRDLPRETAYLAVRPARPWNVLAITFTNKAAGELKERLRAMLGETMGGDVNASTFHSACVRILRRDAERIGFPKSFTIYDTDDQQRVLKQIYKDKMIDDKFLPIKSAVAQISSYKDKLMSAEDVAKLQTELAQLAERAKTEQPEPLMTELEWLHYKIVNQISCILLAQLDADTEFNKIATVQERIDYLTKVLEQLAQLAQQKRTQLESADLFAVVAKQTGIPLGKVQSKERDRLINAEATLKKRVVGQDHAVKIVLDAVFESRSGLNKKGQPMGSFFFLGPTGTGKTELSKALAAFLFEDESALIRFDMSEFKEEHSVALLYGAPPGYVGYEEGGLLVNKIRQKPYSVVLFDEIEKAHKSVFDLFLQILDEGKLHDRLGRVGDFSNALILFTSNIGSQFIVDSFNKGVIPQNNDLMDIMQNYFRPEFLGRLTEIVPFSPITEETVTRIFDIHLKGLLKLLEEQDIKLEIDPETKRAIAMMGYNPQYGARPVIGIIRKELRHPLSKLIISGQIKSGDTVQVRMKEGMPEFVTL